MVGRVIELSGRGSLFYPLGGRSSGGKGVTEWVDPTKIVACAMRAQASWMYMFALVGFVWAAWSVSPDRVAIRRDRE